MTRFIDEVRREERIEGLITPDQFDTLYTNFNCPVNLVKFLESYCVSIDVNVSGRQGYTITSLDDLYAVMEAEMYKELTGRDD